MDSKAITQLEELLTRLLGPGCITEGPEQLEHASDVDLLRLLEILNFSWRKVDFTLLERYPGQIDFLHELSGLNRAP